MKKTGSTAGTSLMKKWILMWIEWMAAYLLPMEHFSCRLDCLVKNGNGIWKLVRFVKFFILTNEETSDVLYKRSVQRWYSGMFGVGTMHWISSNSMHDVWQLNADLLKQKYRMHNLYVEVCFSRFYAFRMIYHNKN